MTDTSISEMTFTMLSLLFLLLGVVLIATIVMSTINPYEQIVFANTEKIRATMDQACSTGKEATITFNLPQNTPSFSGLFTVMPIWIMTTNGDPNYVLYYEGFPPGDAIGWEIYQNMQNRLIVPLPDNFEGKNYEDVTKYVEEVVKKAKEKNVGLIEGVIINNIVLNDQYRSDFYLGQKPEADIPGSDVGAQAKEKLEALGKWKTNEGDNVFKFNNYAGLNSFEKSSVKYAPCGENSLCLKTRDGVYKFPLTQCSDIKGIQMVYDARDRDKIYASGGIVAGVTIACAYTGGVVCAAIGGFLKGLWSVIRTLFVWLPSTVTIPSGTYGIYEATSWVAGAFLSYKTQDFALASPCSIKEMTVTKANCVNAIPLDWALDQKACAGDKIVKTQLFEFDSSGKLRDAGDRYICGEKVNNEKDTLPASSFDENDECLQVKITEKADDFCWTPDPFKDTLWPDTQLIAKALKFTPVYNSLSYINPGELAGMTNYVFVNKRYEMGELESFREWAGRKLSWGWPG